MTKGITSSSYIAPLLQTLEKLNLPLDPKWIPRGFDLDNKKNTKVNSELLREFVRNIFNATKEHRLSFELGKSFQIPSHGFLGYALKSALNVRETIEICNKYLNTVTSDLTIDLDEYESFCSCNYYFSAPPDVVPFFWEAILSMTQCYVEEYGIPKQYLEVVTASCTYDKPAYFDLYKEYLNYNFRFNQPCNSLSGNNSILSIQSPFHDPTLKQLSLEQLNKIACDMEDSTLIQVKKYIRQNISNQPNLIEVADKFHTSTRTLKRRLAKYDANFSDLLNETRINIALDLLQTSTLSIEDIALRVGYSHASSFINAFKRRMGTTPANWEYRLN